MTEQQSSLVGKVHTNLMESMDIIDHLTRRMDDPLTSDDRGKLHECRALVRAAIEKL